MKKVFFALAVVAMFSFVACNNTPAEEPAAEEGIENVAEEAVEENAEAVEGMAEEAVAEAEEAVAE